MIKKILKFFVYIVMIISIMIVGIYLYASISFGEKPSLKDQEKFVSSNQYNKEAHIFENQVKNIFEKMNQRKMEFGVIEFLFGNKNFRAPTKDLPVLHPKLEEFLNPSNKVKIIWFGHSTFMINMDGVIVLVDPIFSKYASPVPFLMERFQKTPLTLEELPNIDYILISHDHYDHLDTDTVKFFKYKNTKFLTPLGVGSHLRAWGILESNILEFDWWQSARFNGGIEFIATPAQHFSGRSYDDRNSTLWSGWIIKNFNSNIFYSGDSGYNTHFTEIGNKYGPFDLALLDNGQYNKQWEEVHLLPEQGIQAIKDLRAKVFFPVHWGAFKLSLHPWYEPIQKAYEYSNSNGIKIVAPKIGQILILDENDQAPPWWEEYIDL